MLYTSKPGNGIKWEVVFTSCGTQDKGSTQCILVGCMYVLNWNCSFLPLKNSHIYLKENCVSLKKNYNWSNQSITDPKISIYCRQFKYNFPITQCHYSWDISDSKDRFSKLVVKKFKWYCMTYYILSHCVGSVFLRH